MSDSPRYVISTNELAGVLDQAKDKFSKVFDKNLLIKLPGGKRGIPPQMLRAYLSEKGVDYSFRVIAYINLKGGTGKTTSTISTATRAAQYGFKTCILDMDSQANASLAFDRMPDEDDPIFFDIWQNPTNMVMGSLQRIDDHLYILPSSLENSMLDINLINPGSQKGAVRGVCDVIGDNGFDLAVIDCPPSLGTAVISTICAADILVVPVCSDPFSIKGLEFTLREVDSICDTFRLEKPKIYILLTKFDKRLAISANAFNRMSDSYPESLIPFPIRTSSEYSKMIEKKQTVFAWTGKSRAKNDYDRYVRYLLEMDKHL
jgi:chromosome partitioning protein